MPFRIAMVAVLAIGLAGCTKAPPPIVPVTGIVTINGKPLAFAEVRFYPQAEDLKSDYIGIAVTDKDGRYTLTTMNQPGGCACANKVTVAEASPPEEYRSPEKFDRYKASLGNRPIPSKYGSIAGNLINITVIAGQTEYPIELTRE